MKPLHEYIPYAQADDVESLNHFDIADRVIVVVFLAISMITFVLVLDLRLTESEMAELAPALNLLPWILLFFMAWPVIRIPTYWIERAIRERAKPHVTRFVRWVR